MRRLAEKGFWPQYRLLSTIFKEDPQGLDAFQHEWMLQKKWLIATGWSIMTLLLMVLGILVDASIITIPGRTQQLGLSGYLLMLMVAGVFAAGSMAVAWTLNRRFDQPATEPQIAWAMKVIKQEGSSLQDGIRKGELVRLVANQSA